MIVMWIFNTISDWLFERKMKKRKKEKENAKNKKQKTSR